jgi:small subunit ribosomal protein S12
LKNNKKRNKIIIKNITSLRLKPQVKSITQKVMIITPKKPNSARRSVVKVSLIFKNNVFAYVPGIGHNLRKHSLVLIQGRGARDLPGVSFRCIRNKFDLASVLNRTTRRSIFGVKIKVENKLKLRRKFRQV